MIAAVDRGTWPAASRHRARTGQNANILPAGTTCPASDCRSSTMMRSNQFDRSQGYDPALSWADDILGRCRVTKEQCRSAFENQTFDGAWYYKNRYSACQVITVFFNSYVGDRNCRWGMSVRPSGGFGVIGAAAET